MREQKHHLDLSESERSFMMENFVWFQSKLREQGRYTDAVDDLIIKFSKARRKKIKVK